MLLPDSIRSFCQDFDSDPTERTLNEILQKMGEGTPQGETTEAEPRRGIVVLFVCAVARYWWNGQSMLCQLWPQYKQDLAKQVAAEAVRHGDTVSRWLDDPSDVAATLSVAHAVADESSATASWPAIALVAMSVFPWAAGTVGHVFLLTASPRDAADARWTNAAIFARAASVDPTIGDRVVTSTLGEVACSTSWQEAIDLATRWADEAAAKGAPHLAVAARRWLMRAFEGLGRWTDAPPGWSYDEAKTLLFRTATACVVQAPYLADVHVRMAELSARGDAVGRAADHGPAMRRALDRGLTRLLGSLGKDVTIESIHAHMSHVDGARLAQLLALVRSTVDLAPYLHDRADRLALVRGLLSLEAAECARAQAQFAAYSSSFSSTMPRKRPRSSPPSDDEPRDDGPPTVRDDVSLHHEADQRSSAAARCLFVHNVPFVADEEAVRDLLQSLLPAGVDATDVQLVRVPRASGGRSRGFAVVVCTSDEVATTLSPAVHGVRFGDRQLHVCREADDCTWTVDQAGPLDEGDEAAHDTRTVFVSNIASTVDTPTVRTLLKGAGVVLSVRRTARKPFGYVEFSSSSPEVVQRAVALTGTLLGGQKVRVQQSTKTSKRSAAPAAAPALGAGRRGGRGRGGRGGGGRHRGGGAFAPLALGP